MPPPPLKGLKKIPAHAHNKRYHFCEIYYFRAIFFRHDGTSYGYPDIFKKKKERKNKKINKQTAN